MLRKLNVTKQSNKLYFNIEGKDKKPCDENPILPLKKDKPEDLVSIIRYFPY
jgi:hypothetical protein